MGKGYTVGVGLGLTWSVDQDRLCLERKARRGEASMFGRGRVLECFNVYAAQSGELALALAAEAKKSSWSDGPWELEPQKEVWRMLVTWRAPIPPEALTPES